MNILVLGTIDCKGGAALVSWELRRRLKADGHTVNTFVRYKYSNESDVFVIPRKRWQDWLVKLFANDLTFARTNYIFNTLEYKAADIIHCHNLHSNFFNLRQLIRMSREKTVIWTLHDIWAITGFANDSATRQTPNKKKFLLYLWDRTKALLKTKERIYKKSKLNIVTVSKWLKGEVDRSILSSQKIRLIYNGVDTNIFQPHDKIEARKKLGLPINMKLVAFPLKGLSYSSSIVNDFKFRSDVFFISIGNFTIETSNKNYKSIGHISDKNILSLYYSAIDVFFYPTQGDTFGLVAAEAHSCGTPVVTNATDALPEIVSHKETGYIAKYNDISDMKNGLEYILSLPESEYNKMSLASRVRIEKYFSSDRMYDEYLKLYSQLLADQSNKRKTK